MDSLLSKLDISVASGCSSGCSACCWSNWLSGCSSDSLSWYSNLYQLGLFLPDFSSLFPKIWKHLSLKISQKLWRIVLVFFKNIYLTYLFLKGLRIFNLLMSLRNSIKFLNLDWSDNFWNAYTSLCLKKLCPLSKKNLAFSSLFLFNLFHFLISFWRFFIKFFIRYSNYLLFKLLLVLVLNLDQLSIQLSTHSYLNYLKSRQKSWLFPYLN